MAFEDLMNNLLKALGGHFPRLLSLWMAFFGIAAYLPTALPTALPTPTCFASTLTPLNHLKLLRATHTPLHHYTLAHPHTPENSK